MSFSVIVKDEIAKQETTKLETISLLAAYLRNNAVITNESIVINSENESITNYIFEAFKNLYDVIPSISVRKKFNFKKTLSYMLEIKKNKENILKDLSLSNEDGYFINIPKKYIYEDNEEKTAYIKGLFFATGSLNDPKTSNYHLEFLIDDYEYAIFICDLLDNYELNSKIIERKNGFVVYIKEAEKISDFLRIVKTYNAVMYFEDIRIYKDHKNMVNRLNNCEQANVEKTVNSALKQIEDINLIEEKIGLDILDDKLKELALYRIKYPEVSLNELSEIVSMETNKIVSKSGINHRMRKLKDIANNLRL